MKRLFTILLCLLVSIVNGQRINFDSYDGILTQDYRNFITIDTVNYHNNKWQIGRPQKTIFDSAYSLPNVIVTDTLNAYPANDTSSFILKLPKNDTWRYWEGGPLYTLGFNYQLNIDSNAFVRFEMSEDSGKNWILAKDTIQYAIPYRYSWSTPGEMPELTKSTTGWTRFNIFRHLVGVDTTGYDSVMFRFTIISDSAFTGKDGWEIDDINFWYWFESTPQLQNPNLISLYPNPSKGNIQLHSNAVLSKKATITVYNMGGQGVYKSDKLPQDGNLHLSLPDGIYTLKYSTDQEYCVKKIVIAN